MLCYDILGLPSGGGPSPAGKQAVINNDNEYFSYCYYNIDTSNNSNDNNSI